jgi:type IV secretion system protein VirD4
MIRRPDMSARTKSAWLITAPLAALVCAAIATIIAWLILGLPTNRFDPLKVPQFFWYYRADPAVLRALGLGGLAAAAFTAVTAYMMLAPKKSLHGTAAFATEAEIRKHGLRAKRGIIIGKKRGRYLVFGGTEHVIIEAPTRTGKGVGVVIPNLLTWEDSVVVLDVKRENFEATAGFRKRHGQAVYLFNPTDREGRTARFNPLSYIDRADENEVIIELQKIATMLFVAPERGEPFWTDSAKTGFIGVGAFIAQDQSQPFTIGAIYRAMTQGDVRGFYRYQLERSDLQLSMPCRSALSDFTSGAEPTFASIVQSITSKLSLWLNPNVDAATQASDFDLRDMRKKPISLYLGVSPDELDRVAPLYNLIFQQLIDLNVRTLPDATTPLQLLVILDEFARLGRAAVLQAAFSYVAGYGIRLLPVIQSRSQLRAVYGNHGTDDIVANCGVELAFTPKEMKVANELSERIGYIGQESVSRSISQDGFFSKRSRSISDQRRALILPQDLMKFPEHEMLIIRGGMSVARANKIRFYNERLFKRRVHPSPKIAAIAPTLKDVLVIPDCVELTEEQLSGADTTALEPGVIRIQDMQFIFADVNTEIVDGQVVGTIAEGRDR